MSIEELLADESFIRYCNKSSAADIAYWEKILHEYPEHRLVAERAFDLYHELHYAMSDLDQQEDFLRQKLNETVVSQPVRKLRNHGTGFWLKWAAAACVIIVLGFYFYTISPKQEKQITYSSANGERKTLQLSDGSLIILNGGSSVSVDEGFNKNARNVTLQGEAYFEVKPNANLPFIVYTPYMNVRAVGTAFSIKAYPGEKTAETILIKGLVEVTLKEDSNKTVMLYPLQKVSVKGIQKASSGHPVVAVPAYDTASVLPQVGVQGELEVNEIAWTQNKLVIDDSSLEEIAAMLERWYGVNVEFVDQEIRDYRYTGAFDKEELNTVLEFLKETRYFRYEIVNDESRKLKLYQK